MLKVAAYARVSTDKDDQINSLTNQREYFESYIKSKGDWEFVEVYFDEGITGTQTKKRKGFNRMINDCKNGKIDLILTKEVSRFARNTVDTLNYTRMLKEYDVGVFFINDNIDTRQNDGEFRLAIMASVAQEESRKISERVKWGQRRAMENGVVFGNNSIVGFDINDGVLSVNESEAEVVKLIFHKYVNEGKGTHIVARELYEEGIKPPKSSKDFWSSTMILNILRNEKYVGDLLQKKYVTKDYLTHHKVINESEDKIYIENHHVGIISRKMWNMAQAELQRRSVDKSTKKKYSNRYWCSGKIICSECGSRFVIRKSKKKSGIYITWACHERTAHGNKKLDKNNNQVGCNMRTVNNKSLLTCMKFITEQLDVDINNIADDILNEINNSADTSEDNTQNLTLQIQDIQNKKMRMLDSYYSGDINKDEMTALKDKYDKEIEKINAILRKQQNNQTAIQERQNNTDELRNIIINAVCSENVYGEIVDKIIVYDNNTITVKLKTDIESILQTGKLPNMELDITDGEDVNFNYDSVDSAYSAKYTQKARNKGAKVYTVNVFNEGDPLEIFTESNGTVIFKKYSPIGELGEFAAQYAESLSKSAGIPACITDKDNVIAVSGVPKKELREKKVSGALEKIMNAKSLFTRTHGDKSIQISDEIDKYEAGVVAPIVYDGDSIGAVVFIAEPSTAVGEVETKLAETAAGFLGKTME